MAADRALLLLAHRLDVADIGGDADRTFRSGEIGDGEHAAVALDHRRQRLFEDRARGVLLGNRVARLRAQEFLAVAQRQARRFGLDRGGIGAVDPFQAAVGVAHPERHLQDVDQAEQHLVVAEQPPVLDLEAGMAALRLGQRQEADDDVLRSLAALHLDRRAAGRLRP